MSFSSDDLASVLIAPDREFAGYGQGILLDFDPETFANRVDYRGSQLVNLPVLDRVGALSYTAGEVVLLMKWRPAGGKGAGSYWIAGSPIIPGVGNAEEAVAFLSSNLAQQISAEVFAARTAADSVDLVENSTSSSILTFTDLATVGPTVEVDISEAGKMYVFFSSVVQLNNVDGSASVNRQGTVSYDISGATTRAASLARSGEFQMNFASHNGTNPHVINTGATVGRVFAEEGLNPGTHTVQLKYSATTTGINVNFSVRTLVVLAL